MLSFVLGAAIGLAISAALAIQAKQVAIDEACLQTAGYFEAACCA